MNLSRAMNGYERVKAVVERARALGHERLENGAEVIGHVPAVAPQAYLHTYYPPLDDNELATLAARLGRPLPAEYASFLSEGSNGLHLFLTTLSIYGFQRSMSRDPQRREPFDLITANLGAGLRHGGDPVVVGVYDEDTSKLVIIPETGEVEWREDPHGKARRRWDGFPAMLADEAERLAALFDAAGGYDDEVVTTPDRA